MPWTDVSNAKIRLREDGVAEIRHDPGVLYTRDAAETHTTQLRELLGGRRSPLLVVVGDGFRPDAGAREFLLRSDAIADAFTAGALLFGGRAEAVAVNVFLKVRRPVRPMKAFTDERAALTWLVART